MDLATWFLAIAVLQGAAGAPPPSEARLAELVGAARSADYRGDREALARLDSALGALGGDSLADYRAYWQGFARWRRALNGFNETPTPTDLVDDLERALTHFRASLELRPDWVESKLAMAGCLGSLMFLARDDKERKQALLAELVPAYHFIEANGRDNPRALWIMGGFQFSAPPPWGGDLVKAAATMQRGIELSWREAIPGGAPIWVPTWGGPENLMNLAYMYAHAPTPDRTAALAYADGALTSVPEWHYVRDILLPQIQALPAAAAVPAAAP